MICPLSHYFLSNWACFLSIFTFENILEISSLISSRSRNFWDINLCIIIPHTYGINPWIHVCMQSLIQFAIIQKKFNRFRIQNFLTPLTCTWCLLTVRLQHLVYKILGSYSGNLFLWNNSDSFSSTIAQLTKIIMCKTFC